MSEMPYSPNPMKRTILSDQIESELYACNKRPEWNFRARESICNHESCNCSLLAVTWFAGGGKPLTRTWNIGQVQKRGVGEHARMIMDELEQATQVSKSGISPEFDNNDFYGILE